MGKNEEVSSFSGYLEPSLVSYSLGCVLMNQVLGFWLLAET